MAGDPQFPAAIRRMPEQSHVSELATVARIIYQMQCEPSIGLPCVPTTLDIVAGVIEKESARHGR